MRKFLAFLVLASVMFVPGLAQADWTENFDSYLAGSSMDGQGGWHGWDANPGATAYVSDAYSHSSPNSVNITGASDLVHEYTGYTSGTWTYTAWMYIPTDFTGTSYFILLNTYNNGGPYNWSTQIQFNQSQMAVIFDPDEVSLPLILGQWVELKVVIDLDADTQTVYYNGNILIEKSWTEGNSGGGALNIAAVDLFANNASPIYWDDLSLLGPPPVPVQNSSWGQVKNLYR